MNDLKKYGMALAITAGALFVFSRLVPGLGSNLGLATKPMFPLAPFPFGNKLSMGERVAPRTSSVSDLF
jgi:hypothetical protein